MLKRQNKTNKSGFFPSGSSFPAMVLSVLLFLLVWELAARILDNRLLFVGPAETLRTLLSMGCTPQFWTIAGLSASKMALSFALAFCAALLLAALSCAVPFAETLLRPYMLTISSVPVASFIVLALLWLSSGKLSLFISFLMILPVLYENSLQGLRSADTALLELAEVSGMSRLNRIRLIHIPALKPYLLSASRSALGICWKAGIAAEVIGVAPMSIGGALYQAKVSLEIPELFAWTAAAVLLCTVFEKLVLSLLRSALHSLEVPKWTSP